MLGRECPGVRLRALLPFLGLLVCLCSGCSGAWAAQPARPGEPLARAFSELFQDPERNTRLEACFLSVGLPERPEHVRILRHNLANAGPVERIVTLYALAAMTRAPGDVDAFLDALPEQPQLFLDVGSAEWDLALNLGTGMADFLLLLVHEPRTRDRALPHLARIICNNGPAETLTGEALDPLVKPYLEAHGDALVLKEGYRSDYERGKTYEAKIETLMLSGDLDSRIAALLIYRYRYYPEMVRRLEEDFQQGNIKPDMGQTAVLRLIVDGEVVPRVFPTDQASVEAVLQTEKRLYKTAFHSLAYSFMSRNDPRDAEVPAALLRYGDGWLETVERHYLQNRVKGE